MRKRGCILAACLAAVGSTAALSQAAVIYQTIALTGTDGALGPGEGAGVTFSSIGGSQPAMNLSGQVIFRANDSTTGLPNGLWVYSAATNTQIAVDGGPQPGGGSYPTGTAALFNTPLINNAGQTAWRLGAGSGAFSNAGSGPARFALAGDFAPGTTVSGPLAKYASISSGMPLMNQSGQSAVEASLTVDATLNPPVVVTSGVSNSTGIWIGTPGNSQLVLRSNDTLSSLDASGNTRVGLMTASTLVLNGGGHYAVVTPLQGSNVVTGTGSLSNSSILATNRNGAFEVIARVGNAAPDATGAASANLYRAIGTSAPGFNDLGHIVFSSSLRDSTGTQTSAGALFSDVGTGTLRTIAKGGDAMPTVYSRTGSALSEFSGVTWGSFFNTMLLNGSDEMLITPTGLGNTGGSTNTSGILLRDASGNFEKIERDTDVAIAGGASDGSDVTFQSTSSYQLNSVGQVAFMSTLKGTGVTSGFGNNSALWVSDLDGTLDKIVRTGDLFQVAPGDMRTISTIGGLATTGGQDGRPINLDDNGDLAFQLSFTDGSGGIFTAHVPEPMSALGAAGMLTLLAARRRARR